MRAWLNKAGDFALLNLGVVREAWGAFFLLCLFVAGICWFLMGLVYDARLATVRADYVARLSAADAELRQTKLLLQARDSQAAPRPEQREPNTLYQANAAAARGAGIEVDTASSTVRFSRLTGGPEFDLRAPMEFRQYTLADCRYASYGTRSSFGVVRQQDYEGVNCHISGTRP